MASNRTAREIQEAAELAALSASYAARCAATAAEAAADRLTSEASRMARFAAGVAVQVGNLADRITEAHVRDFPREAFRIAMAAYEAQRHALVAYGHAGFNPMRY